MQHLVFCLIASCGASAGPGCHGGGSVPAGDGGGAGGTPDLYSQRDEGLPAA